MIPSATLSHPEIRHWCDDPNRSQFHNCGWKLLAD